MLHLNEVARWKVLEKHMENGVNFINTDGIIIGKDVEIGAETTIFAGHTAQGQNENRCKKHDWPELRD